MSALVRAVRDQIIAHASYTSKQVQVEFDERAPAAAGDLYIIVTFGSHDVGDIADGNTNMMDEVYGVDVAVAIRSPRKPRDRKRDLWIDTAGSFEVHQRNIKTQIHNKYAVNTAANVFITAEEGTIFPAPSGEPCGFYRPLMFNGSSQIREAPAGIFAGVPGETQAALIQTLRFRGARRLEQIQ